MAAHPGNSSLAAYRAVAAHGGVAAADPHQLIVMLMDGALERIGAARGAMEHGEQQSRNRLIHRAVEIVQELRASLNMEAGGELAVNMAALYEYSGRQLLRANVESRPELLDEVGKLLRQIRSAWIQIPAQLGGKP
ncbi:MAG TPA: flagellar export chaperone FliS [Steroidobacteraceae bacterium]|nr:flagellar export chaperone FliS [Steroidobacteraceae bacterium]